MKNEFFHNTFKTLVATSVAVGLLLPIVPAASAAVAGPSPTPHEMCDRMNDFYSFCLERGRASHPKTDDHYAFFDNVAAWFSLLMMCEIADEGEVRRWIALALKDIHAWRAGGSIVRQGEEGRVHRFGRARRDDFDDPRCGGQFEKIVSEWETAQVAWAEPEVEPNANAFRTITRMIKDERAPLVAKIAIGAVALGGAVVLGFEAAGVPLTGGSSGLLIPGTGALTLSLAVLIATDAGMEVAIPASAEGRSDSAVRLGNDFGYEDGAFRGTIFLRGENGEAACRVSQDAVRCERR